MRDVNMKLDFGHFSREFDTRGNGSQMRAYCRGDGRRGSFLMTPLLDFSSFPGSTGLPSPDLQGRYSPMGKALLKE